MRVLREMAERSRGVRVRGGEVQREEARIARVRVNPAGECRSVTTWESRRESRLPMQMARRQGILDPLEDENRK